MKRLTLLLAVFCALSVCDAQKKVRVHTIGDSTMADYAENTTRTRGWGEMFQEFFTDDVEVINYARGGRSTRSFMNEGLWDKVKANIQPGDYVFIQFAHNDEKGGGTYSADGRGTDPWGHYKRNLEIYVNETRALQATPVLITPIVRRYFTKEGTISDKGCHNLSKGEDRTELDYVYVMKLVAREMNVPLIDHTALTKSFVESLGAENTTRLIYVPTDGTHTQATGAALYAQMVAREMKRMDILARYVRPDAPMILNPRSIDFGNIYVGDEACARLDLTGITMPKKNGIVTITAPQGMSLASTPDGEKLSKLEIPYTDGKLWNQCYFVYYTPQSAGTVNDAITVTCKKVKRTIPVTADCKKITKETPKKISVKRYTLKGLTDSEQGITIEKGKWSADIDESGSRYVEFFIKDMKQGFVAKKVTFTLKGNVAYRVASSESGDFYPRTDLGENQKDSTDIQTIDLPINATIKPGERLAIRIFPWCTRENDNVHFSIENFTIEGLIIE
ncbi:MAG: rhamnogalacturonan acetylesterase [Coprobacter sp.]|nr:rhamnogalacturonan acetylesterase [Coprobacter sp.]